MLLMYFVTQLVFFFYRLLIVQFSVLGCIMYVCVCVYISIYAYVFIYVWVCVCGLLI